MDSAVLRAWWFQRQGLDGSLHGSSSEAVLQRTGWARSVGGANPYLTLFSRAGTSRAEADKAVAELRIHELPSARGCTYVAPSSDFALALKVGQGFGEPQEIAGAKKYLGVTDDELDRLSDAVLEILTDEPLDPAALKPLLGDKVRNLGAEGKKRGMSTTLPMVLGRLQSRGQIRRKPVNGRLDQQRYGYVRWPNGPLSGVAMSPEEAHVELARHYFRWIGAASLANFQWFSALGVKNAKAAIEPLGLVAVGDLLAFPEDAESLLSFKPSPDPSYALVSMLDGLFLLRRDISAFLDPQDYDKPTFTDKGPVALVKSQDLSNNAIVDRGRIVGLWEFDPIAGKVIWASFVPVDSEMQKAVTRTATYVRDQLGDARSFSLDSPESRRPVLDALASLGGNLA